MKHVLWLIPIGIVWLSAFLWHILEATENGWYVGPYWLTAGTLITISTIMVVHYIEKH